MTRHAYNIDLSGEIGKLLARSGINRSEFRGKTVLVTGGTGFFGVWMLLALISIKSELKGNLRILVMTRSPSIFLNKHPFFDFKQNVEFIVGDICNTKLENEEVNLLIHMAATSAQETFAGEDQLKKFETLYFGTKNIINQCGGSLENVIFTSSGVAYGENNSNLMLESSNTGPNTQNIGSALALGKVAAEYLISYYAEHFNYKYTVARCFSFAGPFLPLNLHYAFGNFIKDAREGRDIVIRGDGKELRSYLYVGDAVAWLLRLLIDPTNDIVNVGSENAISLEVLAGKIASKVFRKVIILDEGTSKVVDNFKRITYVPSVSKIKNKYTSIEEWSSIDEIIDGMLAFQEYIPNE